MAKSKMGDHMSNDFYIISTLLDQRQKTLFRYYDALNDPNHPERQAMDHFLQHHLHCTPNDDLRLALASRVAALRDDALVQTLKVQNYDDEAIIRAKEEAYLWVAKIHLGLHTQFLDAVEDNKLLNSFYRTLLRGAHKVGLAMSEWQSSWTATIINGVNRDLYQAFNGDEEKIFEMLNLHNLFDKDDDGADGDRCYSVLVDRDGRFQSLSYHDAFTQEVTMVIKALEDLIIELTPLEDDLFGQKESYLSYLKALILAFQEQQTHKLIGRWADVDRAWMEVQAPIQIGHPLEYYEDRYRKAVALEWDVRINDATATSSLERQEQIMKAFDTIYQSLPTSYETVRQTTWDNLSRVQLYISRPALYYGAEFCGLFSAQVVPNDEQVSREHGKKIFAFPSQVLQGARAKPFLAITREFLGQDFLDKERTILFHHEDLWRQIYDISTVGHEYGHILWMENDTEQRMNKNGQFKNIEEFKATTGGLIAYLLYGDSKLQEGMMIDLIKRSVGLIAWMETEEVLPYYCEGLIHLHGLFASGVLQFDQKLIIHFDRFDELKVWYLSTYRELALHYCQKRDALEFLGRFTCKDGVHIRPLDPDVARFVATYWERYQQIGQQIDTHDTKERWLTQAL